MIELIIAVSLLFSFLLLLFVVCHQATDTFPHPLAAMNIADLIHPTPAGEPSPATSPLRRVFPTAIPLNIILEIGAFCAGTFNFKALVNLSLSSRSVHEALKPTLKVPILVWDANKRPGKRFFEACLARFSKEGQAQVVPRRWRNVR